MTARTPSQVLMDALTTFADAEPDRAVVVCVTPEGQFRVDTSSNAMFGHRCKGMRQARIVPRESRGA